MKKENRDNYIYDDENGYYTWYNSFEEALENLEISVLTDKDCSKVAKVIK